MNGISKQFLGLAGGAAALALVAGISPASATPNSFTLDPSGAGFTPSANPAYAPFATAGGNAIGYIGTTMPTTGSGAFTFQAAVQINEFANSTLTGVLGQSVTGLNFDNLQGWQFFITVGVSGTGSWDNGTGPADGATFTAGTAAVTLDLWAAVGGHTANFFDPAATNTVPNGTVPQLSAFGVTGCTTSSCVRVGSGTGAPGTTFSLLDPIEDFVTFTLATDLTLLDSTLFSGQISTPLFIRSGCTEGTAEPIGVTDGPPNTSPSFFSQNQGGGCNPSTNQRGTHDHITWDLGARTDIPEPASLAILGSALLGFGLIRRRRNS